MGQIISSESIKIDASKTEAITKTPLSRSVNELQRFLVMVNYLGKCILTSLNIALHSVTYSKKDAVFELQKPQLDTIGNLKTLVKSVPCLKIVDSKIPTCLKTDASSVGLDAFLQQNYGTVENEK